MSVTARQLIGREEELEAITRFLDGPEQLSGAAVLSGEAGIGKTILWLAGVDAAVEREYRVLVCRPSESETHFSFAGLADLLGDAAGDVIAELPPIQGRALEAALLLGESELHADERAVAAAFLAAVRVLARDCPVCLALDDVQWLDAPSLAALRYAVARLDREPVGALLSARGDAPSWLRRALPEERLHTIHLGGLSLGAIHELLRTRGVGAFPRPTLLRIWETSRGNPYFALELAAALQGRAGALAPGDELPIPTDLFELLHARLDGLSPVALELAGAVAALADAAVPLVESAVGPQFEAGLAEAVAARILEVDAEQLRFTHPLLRSAVAARQTPTSRRKLHGRLAQIVPTSEEQARHLALASARPDSAVAVVLEGAARSANLRGAPTGAAELAEQAVRLTPPESHDDALRRLLLAAELQNRAGDVPRAIGLLERALAAAAPRDERATVLRQLALVHTSPLVSIPLYHDALEEARDEALRAVISSDLALAMRWGDGIERAVEYAEDAVRSASRTADAEVRCRALAVYGATHLYAGRGLATAAMEEAIALERSLAGWPLEGGPAHQYALQLFWVADADRGRPLLRELERAAKERNDPMGEAGALWLRGFLEWRAGAWEEAESPVAESLSLHRQLGILMPPNEFPAAVIAAHRGRIDEARAVAQGALARAETEGIQIAESGHGWVLGFIELSLGNAAAALQHLRRSFEIRSRFMLEPAQRLELGDYLEALIAVGELDEAEEVIDRWERRAMSVDRAWALAILARGRGLLRATRGDPEGAFASFERALAEHERGTDPFHRARTLLALGRTQRRAKKRRAARGSLEGALAEFERLGAPLWAEQARTELARIGGRAPSRGELTEAERRIADLVAEGCTNREVAAALFLTEHSVETALTRVYRKLGVRSRAELARDSAAKS